MKIKKISLIILGIIIFFAAFDRAEAGCCSTNCSEVEASCDSPSNWYPNTNCSEIPSCESFSAEPTFSAPAESGCCSTNCSAVETSCDSPSNWYPNTDCNEIPSCESSVGTIGVTETRNVTGSVFPSQCATGQVGTGAQSGCTHNSDSAILSSQCTPVYGEETCASMSGYLSAMRNDCLFAGTSGVNCDLITNAGFYGREASAFASYLKNNPNAANSGRGGVATGGAQVGTGAPGQLNYPTGFGLPDPVGGVKGVLTAILNWLLMIVGIIAIIAFVISGLQYFFAAGDTSQIEIAKRNMIYSIFGIVAALSGFIIIRAVDAALRANVLF